MAWVTFGETIAAGLCLCGCPLCHAARQDVWLTGDCSVQDGIYALGKAHMRSTPSPRIFPNVAFETVPMFVLLTMALSRPFKEDRLALPLSTSLSSRRSVVRCPWLCAPHVVSQASQHFRPSEKKATCEGCFARQSICSVVSLHSGMSRAVHLQEFSKVDVDH